jgi:hypothetical protein
MAKPDFPLNIDRRRLLAAGAAVVTAAIVPRAGCAKTAQCQGQSNAHQKKDAPKYDLD